MSVNHLKNNQNEGLYLDQAFGRVRFKGDLCFSNSDSSYVYAYNAIAAGQWQECEAVFWKGKRLAGTEYNFHTGAKATGMLTGPQTVDPFFPKDVPHSRTCGLGYRVPISLADPDTLNNPPISMEGVGKAKLCANFNSTGAQTDFSYTTNPARFVVQILLDCVQLPYFPPVYASVAAYILSRMDWAAWAAWRDYLGGLELKDYREIPDFQGFGLKATYYSDTNLTTFSESFTHPNFDINYSTQPPATITSVPLSARFEGYIKFLYNEDYTITVTRDNGARLTIDGTLLINQWQNDGLKPIGVDTAVYKATPDVFAPILIDWNDGGGLGQLKIEWESASQTKEVIPSKFLYPKEEMRPRYALAIWFTKPTHPLTAIAEIARCCNSDYVDSNGKYKFFSYETLTNVFSFDSSNIIDDSFKALPPTIPEKGRPTKYRGNVRNADTRFIETPSVPPIFIVEETQQEVVSQQELYSMSLWDALKVLKMTAKLNETSLLTCEFDALEKSAWAIEPGDVVTIQHRKVYNNEPRQYRILEATDKSYSRDGGKPPTIKFRAVRWEAS